MSDFTALKTAIQNAIKQNGNNEITGNILQSVLLSVVNTMGDGAINDLVTALSNEVTNRTNAVGTEATARQDADTALGGRIDGVSAIVDTISSILAAGYVYKGIATPSTNPNVPLGRVFYIATTAGTYTNFGSLTVSAGINILKYNGSAWSVDVVILIDDVPSAGSQNLVRSGGVQNELALGAVYDVSAKNPTAGPNNDGKWGSLSALLSDANLSTLIPAAYRKGGMSVKFVQSSDNKYIQARCMAQNFTTDVTQWQRVDDVPTAGSENLVKSGGVESAVRNVDEKWFNSNTEDWEYRKTLKIAVNSEGIILPYVGIQKISVSITGTTTTNGISLKATNKETGNSITIGEKSGEITWPVIFNYDNSQNLELINLRIAVWSAGGAGIADTFEAVVTKKNPFDDVAINTDNIRYLKDENELIKRGIAINLPTASTYQRIDFKQGRKYTIVSTAAAARTLSTWNLDKSVNPQDISIGAGATVHFTASADACWLKSGAAFTGVLYDELNMVGLDNRLNEIENDEILNHTYLFDQDTQDWIYEETKTCAANSVTSFPVYLDKQPCMITVSGTRETNTLKVQGLNVDTGNGVDIYNSAYDEISLPFTFNNPREELTFSAIRIAIASVGGGGAKDDITVRIVKKSPILVNKENAEVYQWQQNRLKYPNYQFGVGINCKYDTPQVDALTLPAEGARCDYFYSLYDALVTAYPNYVTKIDCDAEYALTAGAMEKPEELDGMHLYMYKFIPLYTSNSPDIGATTTSKSRLKVFITTGVHPEYMAIWDLYQTMKKICENWETDDNVDALRHEAEYYIMPCSGPWCIENSSRVNYDGVDLNRNAPSNNWSLREVGPTYSGPYPASEYETKVYVYYMETIKPQIFIDHHNSSRGIHKNLMYVTGSFVGAWDVGAAHISAMTRRWKKRFDDTFPNDSVIYGFAQRDADTGTRGWYGNDKGAFSFTYESNQDLLYTDGSYTPDNPRNYNYPITCTLATDGFLNFLLRVLKTYSEIH